MTKIELKTIIPKLLETINFQTYLLDQNYTLVDNVSNDSVLVFFKQDILFEETLYLTTVNGRVEYFSSTYRDKGHLIEFVKNRIEIEGSYSWWNPKSNNLIEACKKLLFYINQNNARHLSNEIDAATDSDAFFDLQQRSFTYFYDAKALFFTDFLQDKGIDLKTLNHSQFKGKLFNTQGLFYKDANYDIINTAFALYNLNLREVGLTITNSIKEEEGEEQEIDFIVPGSDPQGFWLSNDARKDTRSKVKLTLVDSPFEALAHWQIYSQERLYLCFGQKNEKNFDLLYNMMQKYQANIYLASEVKLEHFIYELKFVLFLIGKHFPVSFNMEHSSYVELFVDDCKELKALTERFTRLNNKIINGVFTTLGEHSKRILEKDIIRASKTNNGILFKVPKNLQMLYETNKNLINSFPIKNGIAIEKSTQFSWLDLNTKYKQEKTKIKT